MRPAKLDAVEKLGAHIIGVSIDRWFELAPMRVFPGLNAVLVHPFSDPTVMAGNGTIALEILEDLPDVDAVVVPWGGGGLTRRRRAMDYIYDRSRRSAEFGTDHVFAVSRGL